MVEQKTDRGDLIMPKTIIKVYEIASEYFDVPIQRGETVVRVIMVSDIKKRLLYHLKQRKRYLKEVEEAGNGRITKSKTSQMAYSYTEANKELAICDELEYILNEVKE